MRQALVQAAHHARHRRAFGALLADQPLMRNVLADLALESEAATTLMLRLARAADRASTDPHEAAFARIAIALGKYWVCKRAPSFTYEAMECLGGNGYVEESIMPRLYRESPVNSIWEGSGNVNALDLLRALVKQPDALEAYWAEVDQVNGRDARLERAIKELDPRGTDESGARRLVERMALVLQASLLVRHAPPAVADAFVATRLDGQGGVAYGTLPPSADTAGLLDRAWLA